MMSPERTSPPDFAAIARRYRLASGLSWRAWAKSLGTGLASTLYWERGRVPRNREEIEARMREVALQAQRGGQP